MSFAGAGTCTVEALQAGDGEYQAAVPAQQSFTVAAGSQTISFTSTAPASAVAGGDALQRLGARLPPACR